MCTGSYLHCCTVLLLVVVCKNYGKTDDNVDRFFFPRDRLTEAAEKAKVELSGMNQTSINLPFITATPEGPKHMDTNLTRSKFESMCSDLLDRVKVPVETALSDADLSIAEIDEVRGIFGFCNEVHAATLICPLLNLIF